MMTFSWCHKRSKHSKRGVSL